MPTPTSLHLSDEELRQWLELAETVAYGQPPAFLAAVAAAGLLLAATLADANTGQEFLQVSDKSAGDEAAVLKPLVRQFVREGYHRRSRLGRPW